MRYCTLLVLLPLWAADASAQKTIDTERSIPTVRLLQSRPVVSSGTSTRHVHPFKKGIFDEEKSTVEFVEHARTLRVMDSDVSDKDRAEIKARCSARTFWMAPNAMKFAFAPSRYAAPVRIRGLRMAT